MTVERELGELKTAVQGLADQIERDREERKEYRKDVKDDFDRHERRMNAHSEQIKGLTRTRNILYGCVIAVAALVGWDKFLPPPPSA